MNRSKNSRPWLKWVMNVCCTGICTNSAQAIVLAESVFLDFIKVTFAAKLLVITSLSLQLFFFFLLLNYNF